MLSVKKLILMIIICCIFVCLYDIIVGLLSNRMKRTYKKGIKRLGKKDGIKYSKKLKNLEKENVYYQFRKKKIISYLQLNQTR